MKKADVSADDLLGAAKKGTGCLEDKLINVSSFMHNRIFNPYAAGTQMKIFIMRGGRIGPEPGRTEELMLGQICWIVDRTVTLEVTHQRL